VEITFDASALLVLRGDEALPRLLKLARAALQLFEADGHLIEKLMVGVRQLRLARDHRQQLDIPVGQRLTTALTDGEQAPTITAAEEQAQRRGVLGERRT
jgi:hypothetical protein